MNYRLICILDSIEYSDKALSSFDASPGYLHIHILRSDIIGSSIDSFTETLASEAINFDMYQWGSPVEKEVGTRSAKVSAEEIKKISQVGIGSAAKGDDEAAGDFIGGGEGFLFNDKNYRIIRGNKAVPVDEKQSYWTFQACDFNGSQIITDLVGMRVDGRNDLLRLLSNKSGGAPFVAVFDAEFCGDFLARSNGIFPEDNGLVTNTDSVFDLDIVGGVICLEEVLIVEI